MIAILGALLAFGVIVTYIGPYCKKLCIQHGKHRFVFYFICENLYSKKKKKKWDTNQIQNVILSLKSML